MKLYSLSILLFLSAFLFSFTSVLDPMLQIGSKTSTDSVISLEELAEIKTVSLNEEYVKKGFVIGTYTYVTVQDKKILELKGEGANLSSEILEALSNLDKGDKFSIEKITLHKPTGEPVLAPSISLKVN